MLLLVIGNHPHKKRKFIYLFGGLILGYTALVVLQWQPPMLGYITTYTGLLVALVLVIAGLYMVFRFFTEHGALLHPTIVRDLSKTERIMRRPLPVWVYGIVGLTVGVVEPLRLQTNQHIEWFLLLVQPSFSGAISLLGYVLAVLLPIIIIGGIGLFLHKIYRKHPSVFLLFGGLGIISIGWLLFVLAGQVLHI